MKYALFILCCLLASLGFSQNITVDDQSYTPQQLVEDILIDSNCITNVVVTNTIGGNFTGGGESYGFFDASGSSFPFQSGIVLSTGRLSNVPGPNDTLSDDDAPNWGGDSDLEASLQENNTLNATILEFDFTSAADQISFRYLFASEEYQDGDPNTCQYSDLFGFLIRPTSSQIYENIALVPGTQTPVKVTTVHPEIPGGCAAENEAYFESFNGTVSPINFNGQTKVLTATATTIPNQSYHVKLVIADDFNFRFDSAVFLEAGSFELNVNLGPDRLLANGNPVCGTDTITLDAFQAGMTSYKWFQDGIEQTSETSATFDVSSAGTYNVEATLANTCISYGEIIIEYAPEPIVANTSLIACDFDLNGLTTYDLFDASLNITGGDPDLVISNFYTTLSNIETQNNPIPLPSAFNNTIVSQIVYAHVVHQLTGCEAIAEVQLDISTASLTLPDIDICDTDVIDGFSDFDLNAIRNQIEALVPVNSNITFYQSQSDAFLEINSLNGSYVNNNIDSDLIYVKVTTSTNQCYAISPLVLNVLFTPEISDDESILYCLNTYPDNITLQGGIINDSPSNYYYQWLYNGIDTGVNTSFIDINEIGLYTVIATDPNGCSNTRDITVFASNAPTIDGLTFTELTSNNTATLMVSGEGDYEYALDNAIGFYQDSPVFTGLQPGLHTIFVRDKLGCGKSSISFAILGFPQFFTPNGDMINETWKPLGTNAEFNRDLNIQIYNRYGKLLQVVNPLIGWDGTFNGLSLPSDDYWFIISTAAGKVYRGHFALVR